MFIIIMSQSHEILNSKDNIYYLYIWVYTCVYACVYMYMCGVCMYTGVCSCEFMGWVVCYSVADLFGEIRTR